VVQPNAAVMSGKQPAAKRRKPSSSGDLLDSILGGIDRTMSTTPGAFRAEEEPEVASHYQIVRAPPASDPSMVPQLGVRRDRIRERLPLW